MSYDMPYQCVVQCHIEAIMSDCLVRRQYREQKSLAKSFWSWNYHVTEPFTKHKAYNDVVPRKVAIQLGPMDLQPFKSHGLIHHRFQSFGLLKVLYTSSPDIPGFDFCRKHSPMPQLFPEDYSDTNIHHSI